jgi:predicted nuclease with TOPRIM domain
MNSEDTTQRLNEPLPDAPSTQPLLKELMADIREMKANMATKSDLERLSVSVERIETELVKINVRLDGIEREQTLMRFGMDKIHANALRHEERITWLERQFEASQRIAA